MKFKVNLTETRSFSRQERWCYLFILFYISEYEQLHWRDSYRETYRTEMDFIWILFKSSICQMFDVSTMISCERIECLLPKRLKIFWYLFKTDILLNDLKKITIGSRKIRDVRTKIAKKKIQRTSQIKTAATDNRKLYSVDTAQTIAGRRYLSGC